ncbi:LysR family transcriptional regulator [Hydrogenophaga sp.]|uniref:LysR family transcriptional regulator n=1 Tax=Hydrogenophaga sp. TaxID=1904254 RepID=UPI002638ECF6|nr:LysR family transcriptional regulator [Hydrogenophaga sp.]MCW5653491.1 LysR family transcriptional regulator [Hydrogenophaga sp.]
MNLRQIEVFRAVMTTGSTTEAARLLHVSQPGISRLVRHLELQLGVSLFERRSGRLVPTAEARELQAEIEKVYRGVQHVRDVAAHLRFGTHTTLRVLSSANTALQLVPRSIAALVGQFPAARVLFESLPTREIVKLLVSEEADVALSSAPLDHPALEIEEIGRWQLLCALPAGHALLRQRRPSLASALTGRLVVYSPEAPQSAVIEHWIQSHGVARNVAAEVRSGLAACSVAATGVAMAFVDDLSARAHRPEGLVYAAIEGAPSFPIFGVRNRHRPLSRLGKSFLEIARGQLDLLQASGLPISDKPLA